MIQTSSSNAMGLQAVGLTASMYMIRASAALTDARGIIKILDRIMIAAAGATASAQPRSCRLKKYHLWAFTRTHLAHRCWRWFPGLVRHLPHILLGGTMQGWRYKVRSLRNLPAVAATALQRQSAGLWRRCCVHKDSKRFYQLSNCCLNGPR